LVLVLSPRKLVQRWINRRIPRADELELDRSNVFVLPTREGLLFGGLLIISLLTGINYQNSLIYLFTFVMGAVFFGTILQTFQNLAQLKLTVVDVGEGEAGQPIPIILRIVALDGSYRPSIMLNVEGEPVSATVADGHNSDPVTLALPTHSRGWVSCPPIRIATDYPFGLIRAWSFFRPAREGVATPVPVEPPAPMSVAASEQGDEMAAKFVRGADETHLRGYREGDSLQRVQWKRYARTGQMVVADWEDPAGDPGWIHWDDYPGVDPELRLSYMAARVRELSENKQPFGLTLPGTGLEPDTGLAHQKAALRLLGTYGQPRAGHSNQGGRS